MGKWQGPAGPAPNHPPHAMQQFHYLGALPKISETLWYVATWCDQWVALLSFSAAALKCKARDRWIGWDFRHQYDRLKLLTNNSRFLILPDWHVPNLASRILSLCQKRLPGLAGSLRTSGAADGDLRRPASISRVPFTGLRIGYMWVTPKAFAGPGKDTAPHLAHLKWYS
ncbi:MAG: DUF4338 domain-containing protein [Deltaproteobacteria bacterium]|nr:DUF4338 domain-containing protein [Deltaproteobacteria bacterium]